MASLSRRGFLGLTGALAASFGLPHSMLAEALAAPLTPGEGATTLQQTIRQVNIGNRQYRTLVAAPGEPYLTRVDLTGQDPSPARAARRRSIAYLGHTSDLHIMDAQSPARLEPVSEFSTTLVPGNFRPQETLTVYVQAAMVKAIADAAFSPVTGAPLAALLNTGDMADMLSNKELRWYIDVFDGTPVTPNTGKAGEYEGVQAWEEAAYAYHPDDPTNDPFGAYGFPKVPGLLTAAVSQEVKSGGLPVPWYTVFGNHDTVYSGVFGTDEAVRNLATGEQKPYAFPALAGSYFRGMTTDTSPLTRGFRALEQQFGFNTGFKRVTGDTSRKLLVSEDFMKAHFETTAMPGPVGHGFTQQNLDTGQTFWSTDIGPNLRVFGLDTCNQVVGADGAVPQNQFDWLKAGLSQALQEKKLAIVLSHHNSLTLENTAQNLLSPGEPLIHADQFIDMLLEFPNMIAWLNGHTHINTIQAHPSKVGPGGFWEITTASCIDYPQQQQLVEIVDNRDGTLSLFSTVLDHASPPSWRQGDLSPTGLASLSREFASNDWVEDPLMRRGSPPDRNTEMLIKAPFDMSMISDADLEKTNAQRKATILANQKGAVT